MDCSTHGPDYKGLLCAVRPCVLSPAGGPPCCRVAAALRMNSGPDFFHHQIDIANQGSPLFLARSFPPPFLAVGHPAKGIDRTVKAFCDSLLRFALTGVSFLDSFSLRSQSVPSFLLPTTSDRRTKLPFLFLDCSRLATLFAAAEASLFPFLFPLPPFLPGHP